MKIDNDHVRNAARARELYLNSLNPAGIAEDWQFALRDARRQVASTLRESAFLGDIAGALQKSGRHSAVFRQLLAPPLSQDQFKLVCPTWSKGGENSGRAVAPPVAAEVEKVVFSRLDRGLLRWDLGAAFPSRRVVVTVLRVASTLIAVQQVATSRRGRLAAEQENAVVGLLEADGWTKLPSRMIDTRAFVPPRHFMRKTRFATATTAHQEVDIACGLDGSVVLAMECKVTNDETNSVKRVNDVLKKAAAWRLHWGSFVKTAALLQGVVAAKDVQRLQDADVLVFWSHDLPAFQRWLRDHTK